jgi:hypothetical protein
MSQTDCALVFLKLLEIMIEINDSKCICTYSRNKRLMNRRTIFFSCMAIVTVSIVFGSGHLIGNEKVFALGGIGHGGFAHGFLGHGFAHGFYGPGLGYYGPGYVVDNPCGGGPYSIIDGQAVCTTG